MNDTTCERKQYYYTEKSAYARLRKMLSKGDCDPGSYVYKCEECYRFHITSPKGGKSLERLIREGSTS